LKACAGRIAIRFRQGGRVFRIPTIETKTTADNRIARNSNSTVDIQAFVMILEPMRNAAILKLLIELHERSEIFKLESLSPMDAFIFVS
jgi:hypothetical protein